MIKKSIISVKKYMIPMELITMIGGGLSGFIFRYMTERAKERQELFKMNIQKQESNEKSSNAAVERVPLNAGKVVRRTIVFCLMFALVLAPFILALMNKTMYIETVTERPSWFFGLFGGGTKVEFVPVYGYFILENMRYVLTTIVGMYFGNAYAK